MGGLGVASRLHLLLRLLSESDAEHADEEAILGFGLDERLNQRVPLLDHRAPVISRDVHAVKVRVAVVALHFLALDAHLSPGLLVGVLVQVAQRELENATAERVSRNL